MLQLCIPVQTFAQNAALVRPGQHAHVHCSTTAGLLLMQHARAAEGFAPTLSGLASLRVKLILSACQ